MSIVIKVCTAILAFSALCGASVFRRSFSFAVSRNNRRQTNKNAIPAWNFHGDYDADESISSAYKAISNSKQVATFRSQNRTIIAYGVASLVGPLIQESLGCKPLHTLLPIDENNSNQQYLLITGVAGDCRSAVRYLKQVALNHTFDFVVPPSGEHLANKLGAYLLEQRGSRPLAVHAFVISPCKSRAEIPTIFEVGATGCVNSVRGGTIGGLHMQKARQHLESGYKDNLTVEGEQSLLSKLFDPQLGGSDDSDASASIWSGPLYQYVEIPDLLKE